MRIVLKMLAAPIAGLLALTVALCSFLLAVAGFVCWFLAVATGVGGVVLLLIGHTGGGIAFMATAFLASPYGLPALAAKLLGWLNALRFSLKTFIAR